MEFDFTAAWLGLVGIATSAFSLFSDGPSVHFPGAVNSKFVSNLTFERPSTHTAIPTYRVMDQDGIIVDKNRKPPDVSDEEALTWYKNMLTGTHQLYLI
jgi:2-oxoisovalerate dehydrogenase E1 component alpha subunit